MARRSISRYGGTACNGQNVAKLADQTSTIHTQASGFTSNLRRSSRLKGITAICETKSAIPAILSSKFQQEIGTDARASSPNQAKEESPLHESSHGAPKQRSNAVDVMDSDNESNTNITLMDLLSMCKIKKRKGSAVKDQAIPVIQGHRVGLMMPKEEELELEETISSFKLKKAKSSPTSEKLNKHAKPTAPSSPAEKKAVLAFPLTSVAPESGLDETTLRETISGFVPRHEKENVDGKMKEFAEQPIAVVIKKEAIETCLVESDDDNSMVNSSAVFVNESDFDNKYLVEMLDKVSEREDSKHSDNVASNIVDPFLRDIIKQCTLDFSTSSTSKLENCQITSQDEHLVVGSTKCESPAPNFGVLSMLQHHINLPTELPQKYGQQKMQFEEIVSFDRRDALLVSVENSTEFIESDCEKSRSFSENDRRLVGNRKNGFSDSHLNERIVSLVSQFKGSDSLESHDNFADGWHHGCTDKNNCSGAICNQESLDIGSDRNCSMVNENCGGLVSQSMQPLLNCIISQMDHIIPPVDKLVSVDAPYSMTEAISPFVRPLHEETEQASHYHGGLTTTENLHEVVEWDPQIEKLMPSSQVLMLNRCSEKRPCTLVSDLTDSVNPSGQILCHHSVSQLHDIQAKNTVADLSASSSLESSTQICEERQITMHSTKKKAAAMMFGGNFCSEVEHSPKKLLSNRKEISPNSQEKLLRALNNGGLDDVVKLSYCMKKLCFDKGATKSPSFSVLDDGETFFETEQTIKKQKTMNQPLPEVTKGILKSPDTICSNPYCLKNSSIHAQVHDAILFSQRQMQDTENIATKLLKGLNSLKSIVEETIFSEGLNISSSKFNFDEIRLATKHASKLEVTTKKWLAMMAKDCTRFCKIMRLAENKLASPVNDLHKGRKKITFADEAGGALCQIKIYQQEPVAFIVPKS